MFYTQSPSNTHIYITYECGKKNLYFTYIAWYMLNRCTLSYKWYISKTIRKLLYLLLHLKALNTLCFHLTIYKFKCIPTLNVPLPYCTIQSKMKCQLLQKRVPYVLNAINYKLLVWKSKSCNWQIVKKEMVWFCWSYSNHYGNS